MNKFLPKTFTNTWYICQVNQIIRWRMPSIKSRGFLLIACGTWPGCIERMLIKLQTLIGYHAGMVLVGGAMYDYIDNLEMFPSIGSNDLYGTSYRLVVMLNIVFHSTIALQLPVEFLFLLHTFLSWFELTNALFRSYSSLPMNIVC